MTKPTLENWREGFDQEIGMVYVWATKHRMKVVSKEAKQFISSLLLSLLERVKLEKPIDGKKVLFTRWNQGYLDAIEDLQSLKKKLREEVK